MNIAIIAGIVVLGVLVFVVGRYQLKSDNAFFYVSGRAMRPLDIFLAFDRVKFNTRIHNLTDATRAGFKKWLGRDVLLGAVVHAFIGLLAWACKDVYDQPVLRSIFVWIAFAQLLSFLFHIIADWVMYRSVQQHDIAGSMRLYNAMVILKLLIPLLGLFMCTTTGILLWFQFLGGWTVEISSVIFLLPLLAVTILLMVVLTNGKKKPIQ